MHDIFSVRSYHIELQHFLENLVLELTVKNEVFFTFLLMWAFVLYEIFTMPSNNLSEHFLKIFFKSVR